MAIAALLEAGWEPEIAAAAARVKAYLDAPAETVREADAEAAETQRELESRLENFSFERLRVPTPAEAAVWAVDGGSLLLEEAKTFQVVAYRAGRVRFVCGATDVEEIEPLAIKVVSRGDVSAVARDVWRRGAVDVIETRDALGTLRELAEWRWIERCVTEAAPGAIVCADGSLHVGPGVNAGQIATVTRVAAERGVALVGVTKKSSLRWGDYQPLVPRLARRGDDLFGEVPWFTRINTDVDDPRFYSDLFCARLGGATAGFAFRVDVARGSPYGPGEVLGHIAAVSDDAQLPGYPYPLMRVHQLVSCRGGLKVDLRRDFRDALGRLGVALADVEQLFTDVHVFLDA